MNRITSYCSLVLITSSIVLFALSCTSDPKPKEKDNTLSMTDEIDTLKLEPELESANLPEDTIIPEYKQVSNGLEFKVVQHFQEKYKKGELNSIVKGVGKKMNPELNKVYIETNHFNYDGLGFFHGKYPEFLRSIEDSVETPKNNLLTNNRINCESFIDGKASDFLLKKEKYNTGDLQIIISKAFFYQGSYYVHAWRLSNSDKIFHHRECTFKFGKNEEILDIGCSNYYQMGYGRANGYLTRINTKVKQGI